MMKTVMMMNNVVSTVQLSGMVFEYNMSILG